MMVVLLRRLRAHPDGRPAEALLGCCDAAALATALATTAKVAVLSVGPPLEDEALRHALAHGAARAIRVWDPLLAGLDYHAVARVLAAAIRRLPHELVFTGDMSEDEGQGAIGPAVAEALSLPHVTGATWVHWSSPHALVTRREQNLIRTLRVPSPALVAVRTGPPLPDPVTSSVEIEVLDLAALGIEARELAHRDRCVGRPSPVRLHGNPTLLRDPSDLVARLRAERLL
jgi:electron transfer flavoprotein alpha/beta subunit